MNINFKNMVYWLFSIALICIGIYFFLFQQNSMGFFSNVSRDEYAGEIDTSLYFDGDEFKNLEIATAQSSIDIVPTDGPARVEFKGTFSSSSQESFPHLEQSTSGNMTRLQVIYPKGLLASRISSDAHLRVYLPEEGLTELRANTKSGDINIGSFTICKVGISSESGNIYCESLSPTQGIFETKSGKIELKGISGRILARTSSGDMDVDFEDINDTVYLESLAGNLTVNLPDDASFTLKTETVSGNLSCDIPFTLRAGKGDNILADFFDGGPMMELKTVSGDLLLH